MKNWFVKVDLPSAFLGSSRLGLGSIGLVAGAVILSGCAAGGVLAPILFPAPLVGLRFFDQAGQPILQPDAPGALGFSNVGDPVRLTVPASQPQQRVVFTLLNEEDLLERGQLTEQPAQALIDLNFRINPDSTAVAGRDYVNFPLSLTVPTGQTRATLEIELIQNLAPGERTLILDLIEPAGGDPYQGAPCCTTAILTIEAN